MSIEFHWINIQNITFEKQQTSIRYVTASTGQDKQNLVKKLSYLAQKEYEKQSGHSEDFLDSLSPSKDKEKKGH